MRQKLATLRSWKKVEELLEKKSDEREGRKTAEANTLKLKDELARVQQTKIDEAAAVRKKAKEIVSKYRLCGPIEIGMTGLPGSPFFSSIESSLHPLVG
jgi:hypothetical protein